MSKQSSNRFDFYLIFLLILFAIISFITLYNVQKFGLANDDYLTKQIMWYIISLLPLLVVMFIDLTIIKQLSIYIYLFCVVFLAGILIAPAELSPSINGARGWYRIGSFSVQPAELTKIGLILILSYLADKFNSQEKNLKSELLLLAKMLIVLLPLVALLQSFPDLGSLLVYISIFMSILLVSQVRMLTILSVAALPLAVFLALLLIYFYSPDLFFNEILSVLPSYQAERFFGWLRPYEYGEAGYQLRQSLITIGAGQLEGYGLLIHVPYAYSDFIFAVIGGVFGFLGSSVVITLFFLLLYKMVVISVKHHEAFGSYVGAGVIGMIAFQVFQSIGMCIGLMPITGLSLPFISYGGSSLITNMIAIGLIMNIQMQTREYMFE